MTATSVGRAASWPAATTRPVVLLGWPVHHSLSPALHNAAFAALGLDLVYLALPVRPDDLDAVVTMLGAVGAVGANVTVPHKRSLDRHLDVRTPEAELVGAVNTLAWTADGLVGDNTDAVGLADAVLADGAGSPGEPWVVLGTGGASRAVAVAAGRLGCPLTVVGRRAGAAEDLADLARRAGAPSASAVDLDAGADVARAVAEARTVVNATPLGMVGERLPRPFHELQSGQHAYDLVYNPASPAPAAGTASAAGTDPAAVPDAGAVTPFVADARARGAGGHDGLGMLLGQAAASFRRWTGRDAPVDTMADAARAALSAAGRERGW